MVSFCWVSFSFQVEICLCASTPESRYKARHKDRAQRKLQKAEERGKWETSTKFLRTSKNNQGGESSLHCCRNWQRKGLCCFTNAAPACRRNVWPRRPAAWCQSFTHTWQIPPDIAQPQRSQSEPDGGYIFGYIFVLLVCRGYCTKSHCKFYQFLAAQWEELRNVLLVSGVLSLTSVFQCPKGSSSVASTERVYSHIFLPKRIWSWTVFQERVAHWIRAWRILKSKCLTFAIIFRSYCAQYFSEICRVNMSRFLNNADDTHLFHPTRKASGLYCNAVMQVSRCHSWIRSHLLLMTVAVYKIVLKNRWNLEMSHMDTQRLRHFLFQQHRRVVPCHRSFTVNGIPIPTMIFEDFW